MHFFGLLSLSFLLLVGVNAGSLEQHGYTFEKFSDGYCTVHSDYYGHGTEPLNQFTINVQEKSMIIHTMDNMLEDPHSGQMSLYQILAAVCKEYGLKPDGMNMIAMEFPKSGYEKRGLDNYRRLHQDELNDDQYIDATISRNMIEEWSYFSSSTLYSSIQTMLVWSRIAEISIEESETSCQLFYHIKSDNSGGDVEDEDDNRDGEDDDEYK
ncbi:hypothetical protein Cpir12675_006048 [Ceratocystis pirilliformis]|uniref:Uncharacterized protein n=1 Tax=Ceratocystis pirilliformis TaxID=259994 RepID=A0ABR3YKX2_9PEZI